MLIKKSQRKPFWLCIISVTFFICSCDHTKDITEKLIADFTASPRIIEGGETVQFTDITSGGPDSWMWDFGDNEQSYEQNPSHIYDYAGKYTVTLRVINSVLSEDEIVKEDYIEVTSDNTFLTESEGYFIDSRDGKNYNWVKIGDQIWIAENMNYENTSGSYAYYDDMSYTSVYGRLYDWHIACNICPDGWHLPSDEEWKVMERYLGMSNQQVDNEGKRGNNEGGMLKEMGTDHWKSDNVGATNSSGFNALPGGYRYVDGNYLLLGNCTKFWTSTEKTSNTAWYRDLTCWDAQIERDGALKNCAFSVRCVKN